MSFSSRRPLRLPAAPRPPSLHRVSSHPQPMQEDQRRQRCTAYEELRRGSQCTPEHLCSPGALLLNYYCICSLFFDLLLFLTCLFDSVLNSLNGSSETVRIVLIFVYCIAHLSTSTRKSQRRSRHSKSNSVALTFAISVPPDLCRNSPNRRSAASGNSNCTIH